MSKLDEIVNNLEVYQDNIYNKNIFNKNILIIGNINEKTLNDIYIKNPLNIEYITYDNHLHSLNDFISKILKYKSNIIHDFIFIDYKLTFNTDISYLLKILDLLEDNISINTSIFTDIEYISTFDFFNFGYKKYAGNLQAYSLGIQIKLLSEKFSYRVLSTVYVKDDYCSSVLRLSKLRPVVLMMASSGHGGKTTTSNIISNNNPYIIFSGDELYSSLCIEMGSAKSLDWKDVQFNNTGLDANKFYREIEKNLTLLDFVINEFILFTKIIKSNKYFIDMDIVDDDTLSMINQLLHSKGFHFWVCKKL